MTKRELLKILEDVKDDTEIVIEKRTSSGITILTSGIWIDKKSQLVQDPHCSDEYHYSGDPYVKTLHERYKTLQYISGVVLC